MDIVIHIVSILTLTITVTHNLITIYEMRCMLHLLTNQHECLHNLTACLSQLGYFSQLNDLNILTFFFSEMFDDLGFVVFLTHFDDIFSHKKTHNGLFCPQ